MGSKRKPFIISKAVSVAVVRSGEENDWTPYQVVEIWTLASIHLTEDTIGAVSACKAFEHQARTSYSAHLT